METAKGDCFKAAFDCLVDRTVRDLNPERFVLVHGNIAQLPQDTDVNHAWVEEGETVHEVSNGLHLRIPKDEYYASKNVTNTRRYSLAEAMRLGERDKGPWDK